MPIRLLLSLLLATGLHAAPAAGKPNILYINADDFGVMDLGHQGRVYRTPNLDQLAEDGMRFTEAYAAAANCAPSRACVFSGQNTPRHGVYTVDTSERGKPAHRRLIPTPNTEHLKPDQVTLAEALKGGGYDTIHLGKWHVTPDPTTEGFDTNIGGDHTGSPAGGYFTPFGKGSMAGYDAQYPEGTHRADIFADEAEKWLESRGENPFFMHMAYYLVHTPLQAVPELEAHYQGKDVHLAYATMVEKMDQSIGRILAALDRLGLRDNTLVLFSSDNGGISNVSKQTPYRAGKGSYFEGGVRVPLIVRWPDQVAAGSTSDTPVTGLDFYPTFLAAGDTPVPEGKVLDGSSLLPLLTQSGELEPRVLHWHFPVYLQAYSGVGDEAHDPLFRTRPGSILRAGKWKLHHYFEDDRLELYNLEQDPGEVQNLASDQPQRAESMLRQMQEWRGGIDAPVPTEVNPKFDAEVEAEAIAQAKAKGSTRGKRSKSK